jgi:hypothetical protein
MCQATSRYWLESPSSHRRWSPTLIGPSDAGGRGRGAAGRRTGRGVIGIDPLYVEVALRRWERFAAQAALRIDG